MSGIAGIYFLDGRQVERVDIEQMAESINHRGPDGSGVWTDGPIGLAHLMLCTTPESLYEKLPLVNKTRNLSITADARIDNREELISILQFNGKPPETITDSELIVAAYEKWGEDCPEKLLGDFTFAIWDKKEQSLFCVRDHLGIKPFYYYHQPGQAFVFASEIKALLCLSIIPRRLNEVRVADYLVWMLEDEAITFYKDICRLPPAHSITVKNGTLSKREYWKLDPSYEIKLKSDEEYAEAFREIFNKTVQCCLRSQAPVGCLLSGGLDSSSIVCVAREMFNKNGSGQLKTFSGIFEEIDELPKFDDRPSMKAVVNQGRLDPHYVHADRLNSLVELGRIFYLEEEPFFPPPLFMNLALYRTAHVQGVRVLMDGLDGDLIVSHGFVYLIELFRSGRLIKLAKEITGLSRSFNQSPWAIFKGRIIKPLLPEIIYRAWRILHGHSQPEWLDDTFINPAFVKRIKLSERVKKLRSNQTIASMSSREQQLKLLKSGHLLTVLEMQDRAAAGFSIELRHPFCDRRLVEYCLAIPFEQKLQGGLTRSIMRRALSDVLPEEVRMRGDKTALSMNYIKRVFNLMKEHFDKVILSPPAGIENYIDMDALRQVYQRYRRFDESDKTSSVWDILILALWLKHSGLRP